MAATEAQIRANRRNAALSTGPKTEEGKRITRGNALTHGFSAAVVVPVADEAAVRERMIGVYETIRPQTAFQAWACTGVARTTISLDRLWALEKQIRAGASWRAVHSWEQDQRAEADRIAARITRDPGRTVGLLVRSAAGCDWLIERWALLADVADRHPWTDEQTSLAHDLLGTPQALRGAAPGHTVDIAGRPMATEQTEAQLARDQLADLNTHRAHVAEADARARALAEADADDFHNGDLIRLRRYERALQADLNRYFALSQHESPHAVTNPKLLKAIPTLYLDPTPSQNEPTLADPEPTPGPAPVLTLVESQPVAQNEPNPAPIVAQNEPNPAPIVAQNEPNPAPVVAQNEPNPVSATRQYKPRSSTFGPPSLDTTGMNPELLALLNADLPDPDTLDPAWCRQYIADNLSISPTGQFQVGGGDAARQRSGPAHP